MKQKKTIVFMTVSILLFSIFTLQIMAHKDNKSYGDVPKSADAIVIDGVKDAVYDKSLIIPIKLGTGNETPVSGVGYLLWQDGFIYIFVDVADPYIMPRDKYGDESGQPWMTDSPEAFFDWNNNLTDNEFDQFRIDAYGWRSFEFRATTGDSSYGKDENVADGVFEGKAVIGGAGYQVEFKIPLPAGKGAGSDIGFLFQINDQDADDRHSIAFSTPSTTAGYKELSWLPGEADYIVLSANEVTAVEVIPVEALSVVDTPTEAVPVLAPATGDTIVLTIFALFAAFAAVGIMRHRKMKAYIINDIR